MRSITVLAASTVVLVASTARAAPIDSQSHPAATAPTPTAPAPQPEPAPQPAPTKTTRRTVSTFSESESQDAPAPDSQRDKALEAPKAASNPDNDSLLYGFRLGYGYVMNFDKPLASLDGQSLAQKVGMRTPQQFLIGGEMVYRAAGGAWLNVILVANATIGGLEQSKFFPTANGLIGGEFNKSFQIGVGPSLTPLQGQEAHVIAAAGWTPRVGNIYVPIHAFLIPDVDGAHRMGLTTGVTW